MSWKQFHLVTRAFILSFPFEFVLLFVAKFTYKVESTPFDCSSNVHMLRQCSIRSKTNMLLVVPRRLVLKNLWIKQKMPTLAGSNHAIHCAHNRSDNQTSFSVYFLVQLDLKDPIDIYI